MPTFADIRQKVVDTVKDDSGKLSNPEDFDRNIGAALNRYSAHRPYVLVADVTGNNGHDYSLPTGWSEGFSIVKAVEYPVGNVPADYIDSDEIEIYQSPAGKKLRLKADAPSVSETFRVSYTALRTYETVAASDIDAFVWLSAALCLEELATAFAQSGDSLIAADSVDYRDKTQRFASRAKRLMQLYKEQMGLKDDDITPPASATTDLDVGYPGGRDRLTHPRYLRERR